jgi:hypothetical protein
VTQTIRITIHAPFMVKNYVIHPFQAQIVTAEEKVVTKRITAVILPQALSGWKIVKEKQNLPTGSDF